MSVSSRVWLRSNQSGYSLVELMVAMVLGLLLVGGVVQVFQSGKASYRVQEGLGRLQENGRFADFYLSRVLRQAGRPRIFGSVDGTPGPFFRTIDTREDFSEMPATRDGDDDGSDVVTIMYRSTTNCLGNGTDYDNPMVDFNGDFYARDQFALNNDDPPSLVCRTLDADGNAEQTQPIIAGVDDFQILYGVDSDGDGQANFYQNATNILDVEWRTVVSLRFALLLSSERTVRKEGESDNRQYALLDAPVRGPFDDGRIRQVFESTIELRNRSS